MTFRGKPSVQNFDIVGATIKELALTKCEIPAKLVHRQLDDVPLVAPGKTKWCQEFSEEYSKLCGEINMELAPNCKNNDKAFTCQTRGKVLGINFDTSNLSWSLPDSKKQKTLAEIKNARESEKSSGDYGTVIIRTRLRCSGGFVSYFSVSAALDSKNTQFS